MSAIAALPATSVVAKLLTGIVGKQVTVAKASPMDLKAKAPRVYGVYRDRQKPIICVCVCDLPLSVYAGGAMLTFPACTINDSLRSGSLEEGLRETMQEILNICAQFFNDYGRQVFKELQTSPENLSADVSQVLSAPAARMDMAITIAGYGSGQMAVFLGQEINPN
jgi:hypothetical protein